jgi:hypothetical protein
MNARIARRQFIKQTSLTMAGFWLIGGQAAFAKIAE